MHYQQLLCKHALQGDDNMKKWQLKPFPLFEDMANLCLGRVADGHDAFDITEEAEHINNVSNDACATQQTEDQNAGNAYSFNTTFDLVRIPFVYSNDHVLLISA